MKDCQFCGQYGDIQEQDMGEGRTMNLCATCRGRIADGRAILEQGEAERKQRANWNAVADGFAPPYPEEY